MAKQTEQQVIIKICDDLCKTPTESEQTTKETREHRNRYIYHLSTIDKSDFLTERAFVPSGQTVNAEYHCQVNKVLRP